MAPERPTRWDRLRRRPLLATSVAVAVLGAIVFVLVWFQPQTLLFDTVVDEGFPTTAPPSEDEAADGVETEPVEDVDGADPAPEVAEPSGPRTLFTGMFGSRSRYTVEGEAIVAELEDGSRIVRLEGFSSTNGPDLFVYLTAAGEDDPDEELDADFVDLGVLKGNVGDQNYDVPADVDLARYDTVVIWCRRFTTAFGAADLVGVS